MPASPALTGRLPFSRNPDSARKSMAGRLAPGRGHHIIFPMPDVRPDPDALLASLQRDEARARRAHLKIFLGMCPGVGKTYTMLRTAQQERAGGTDVVVGVVETHGRIETEALLSGLTVIPRLAIDYRGTRLTEMDLEAVRARRA